MDIKFYLLFSDNGLTDHDILVEDFKGTFKSPELAMEAYDSLYRHSGVRGLVSEFDSHSQTFRILYRTSGYSSPMFENEFKPGWIDKWP